MVTLLLVLVGVLSVSAGPTDTKERRASPHWESITALD
ncbi:hypothetical protein GBAR_LOCUS510, partial [Geodia barretti]